MKFTSSKSGSLMQPHPSMARLASTGMLLLMSIAGLVMPGTANAQADPGPPPATAAVVPTIAQARDFIERQLPAAAGRSCFLKKPESGGNRSLSFEHRLSISINGANVILTASTIQQAFYSHGNNTDETVRASEFDVRDVNIRINEGLAESILGCRSAVILVFVCEGEKGSCIGTSNSLTSVDSEGEIEKEKSTSDWAEVPVPLTDAVTANRLLKALLFYKRAIAETEGASPF